jgi:hypothetical protein
MLSEIEHRREELDASKVSIHGLNQSQIDVDDHRPSLCHDDIQRQRSMPL